MKCVIKFEASWADEFDCKQFQVCDSHTEAEEIINDILECDYVSFGSNQGWEGDEITRDNFVIDMIADEDANWLRLQFGKWGFGVGPL